MESQTPRSIQKDIFIQQVGAETLLYDERSHMAYCLNESSSVIWKLADGEHTIAEMSVAASVQLGTAISEDFVSFALTELRRDGLVEAASVAKDQTTISRRAMLLRLGASGAMLLPVISAVVAPTAAQAYSGCVDCTNQSVQAARARRQQAMRRQRASSPSSTPYK